MATKPDNQQRAADFLRQWQEEMTRRMTNPDAIRAMLDAMQHLGKADRHDANARRPAHAPDARDDAIGHLAERIHALEQQLRLLHARMDATENPARTGKRAVAEPRRAGKRAVAKPKRAVRKKSGNKLVRKKR